MVPASPLFCPKCNKEVVIDLPAETVFVVCKYCQGRSVKTAKGNLESVSLRLQGGPYNLPKITIGEKIILREEEFTVTGYAVFKEKGKPYSWSEFYLSNAQHIYSLAEFKGGFSLLRSTSLPPYNVTEVNSKTLLYEERTYKLFNKYNILIKEVSGQIPFDLSDPKAALEYVCPPFILVINKTEGKPIEYFEGDYISTAELERAFGKAFPEPEVTPMGKVWIRNFRPSHALKCYAAFIALLLSIFLVDSFFLSPPLTKVEQVFTLQKGISSVSESFELNGHKSAIEVDFKTYLFNSWTGFDFTLVNEKTNEEIFFYTGLEYYSGIEDGESWSEGSESGEEIISSLPPGRYHLVITPDIPAGREQAFLNLTIIEDPEQSANLFWIVVLAGILPLGFYFIERKIDRKRWYNSDYSPYTYYE